MTDPKDAALALERVRVTSQASHEAENRLAEFNLGVPLDDPTHPSQWPQERWRAYEAASEAAHKTAQERYKASREWAAAIRAQG